MGKDQSHKVIIFTSKLLSGPYGTIQKCVPRIIFVKLYVKLRETLY